MEQYIVYPAKITGNMGAGVNGTPAGMHRLVLDVSEVGTVFCCVPAGAHHSQPGTDLTLRCLRGIKAGQSLQLSRTRAPKFSSENGSRVFVVEPLATRRSALSAARTGVSRFARIMEISERVKGIPIERDVTPVINRLIGVPEDKPSKPASASQPVVK